MSVITVKNYAQHKPDRATLSPGEQDVYDSIEEGALEFYDEGPEFSGPIDLYLAALNRRGGASPAPAPKPKHPKRPTVAQRKTGPAKVPVQRKQASPAKIKKQREMPRNDKFPIGQPVLWDNGQPGVIQALSTNQAGYAGYEVLFAGATVPVFRFERELTAAPRKGKAPAAPKAPKAPKAVKVKPADTRRQVPQLPADVTYMQAFLRLVDKPVSLKQVAALHQKLDKAITKQQVRLSSKHAADLQEIANLVAKTYRTMTEREIVSVAKLEFDNPVVGRARTVVAGVRIATPTKLLSQFINMQGRVPVAKAVHNLRTALSHEYQHDPNGEFALAVGAAEAVLSDWQPGQLVRITEQQLSGLSGLLGVSGLGCPDTPSQPCGCQKKKSDGLGSTPGAELMDVPAAEPVFTPWFDGGAAPDAAPDSPDAAPNGIFTTIGQKDTRRAVGETLPLPGALGKFIGTIERHEYAMALRGDKGAGKSRLQYQILNLLAFVGLNCALFSLEIDKNSNVVERYTKLYIAPANRARVQIASEAPGGMKAIRDAAKKFDVVGIDSWGKIPGVAAGDFDKLRKEFPRTLFIVIFQSTTAGTARGGSANEYDASAVCQVNLPGVAVMEKNRYATGAADELKYDVNAQQLTS